jgi:protoporphyrinogen oxidase
MEHYKYAILGAGPSGLSLAHALVERGENAFIVIEKENEAGGLCRSQTVNGHPLDTGGGHFLDTKREKVLNFLFKFLPEPEWKRYSRKSVIAIRGREVDYPLEGNLWQLPVKDQLDFLESLATCGCVSGLPMPTSFEEWISWKLGDLIASEYMLPYNQKLWGCDLGQLGTYWLSKLPNASFRESLQSCLERSGKGSLPAHGEFLYPKAYGYGEVWARMANALGDKLRLNTPIESLDVNTGVINGVIQADTIVTTIPWPCWTNFSALPKRIDDLIGKLRYSSIDIDYWPANINSPAHWIYCPDLNQSYHRILCRANFVLGSVGHWTETNTHRASKHGSWFQTNPYSYPISTQDKPDTIKSILEWGTDHGIVGLGRWGSWDHFNSDVVVEQAMDLATQLVAKRSER